LPKRRGFLDILVKNLRSDFNWFGGTWPYLLGIVAIVILVRLNFVDIPFERDEGAYSYYASLILDGGIPYKDYHSIKYPVLPASYAVVMAIFGRTVAGMHVGFIFLNVASLLVIYLIGKRLLQPWVGVISAGSFALFSINPYVSGYTIQSEHFIVFYISLGVLLSVYGLERNSKWLLFFSGFLMCLAFQVKQTAALFCVFLALAIALKSLMDDRLNWKRALVQVGVYSSGVLTAFLLMILTMVALGVFNEMWYWTVDYANYYASQLPWSVAKNVLFITLGRIVPPYFALYVLAAAGLLILPFLKISRYKKIFFVLFAGFSILSVFPGNHFFWHYWLQQLPSFSLMVGILFLYIFYLARHFVEKSTAQRIAIALFLVPVGITIWSQRDYLFNPDYHEILREVYGMNPFPEAWEIAKYIKARTVPDDKIAVFGSEPEIYFYTQRRCPSSHNYMEFLVQPGEISSKMQHEFIADLETDVPKYLVWLNLTISWQRKPGSDTYIFEWIKPYLAKHFKQVGIVDMISPEKTVYTWGDESLTYRPNSTRYIEIYERQY